MDNISFKIHNESILHCDKDAEEKQQKLSFHIIDQTSIDYTHNKKKLALQELEFLYDQKIKELEDFAKKFEQQAYTIQQIFNQIKLSVEQKISHLIEKKNLERNKINCFSTLQFYYLNNELIRNSEELNTHLKNLQNNIKIDQLKKSLDQLLKDQLKIYQSTDQNKMFNFRMIKQSTYIQEEQCCAFAFNNDASIMIASCNSFIKVFEFKDYKPKEIQQLKQHASVVYYLKIHEQIQLVHICKLQLDYYYMGIRSTQLMEIKLVLKGHQSYIYCLTNN